MSLLRLSIDPGRHSGIAWWLGSELMLVRRLELGRHAQSNVIRVRDEITLGLSLLQLATHEEVPPIGTAHAVVEGQWSSPGISGGFDRVASLVEVRCAWQHVLELLGASVEVVKPAIWVKAAAPKSSKEDTRPTAKRIKERTLELYPEEKDWTEDQRAAVLLGWWRWDKSNPKKEKIVP